MSLTGREKGEKKTFAHHFDPCREGMSDFGKQRGDGPLCSASVHFRRMIVLKQRNETWIIRSNTGKSLSLVTTPNQSEQIVDQQPASDVQIIFVSRTSLDHINLRFRSSYSSRWIYSRLPANMIDQPILLAWWNSISIDFEQCIRLHVKSNQTSAEDVFPCLALRQKSPYLSVSILLPRPLWTRRLRLNAVQIHWSMCWLLISRIIHRS